MTSQGPSKFVQIHMRHPVYTDEYHITSRKVDEPSDKPIYKLVSGDEYIYYLPDEFGWRIGDIIGNDFDYFSYESKD